MFESHFTVEEQQVRAAAQHLALQSAMQTLRVALEDRVEGEDGAELVDAVLVEKALTTIKAVRGGATDHAVLGRVLDAEMRTAHAETEVRRLTETVALLRQALDVRAA
jgi:hypothetical protein